MRKCQERSSSILEERRTPVPIINFCQKKSEKRTKKWVKIDKFLIFTFYGVFSQFILAFSKKYYKIHSCFIVQQILNLQYEIFIFASQ